MKIVMTMAIAAVAFGSLSVAGTGTVHAAGAADCLVAADEDLSGARISASGYHKFNMKKACNKAHKKCNKRVKRARKKGMFGRSKGCRVIVMRRIY